MTPLIRNSGTPYVLNMHYVYKYALQEDSLLKCFKSYFEEKNLLLYTIFGWTLGSLAGRLHINRPEGTGALNEELLETSYNELEIYQD